MNQVSENCINKIYPVNWDRYGQREKEAKEQEFNVVSFFLKTSSTNALFEYKGRLCVELYEEPDFLIYPEDMPLNKIGLEVTKCYADEKCNAPKVNSDLEKCVMRSFVRLLM